MTRQKIAELLQALAIFAHKSNKFDDSELYEMDQAVSEATESLLGRQHRSVSREIH